jgi:hypothetical protein
MPRSHRITCEFPCAITCSAASNSSFTVADIPRLSSTGVPRSPTAASSEKFCMLRAADLDHVGNRIDGVEVARVHELGHYREARHLARFGQQREGGVAQATEGVGRGAWFEGAAPEQSRPRRANAGARDWSSISRPSTEHGPANDGECRTADGLAPRCEALSRVGSAWIGR